VLIVWLKSQYSQQQSVPDLSVFTLKFHSNFNPEKNVFSEKKKSSQKKIFLFTFFLCSFSVRTLWGFQKKKKKNFDPEKVKKRASKVAHNRPRSFYFTVQPRPTAHSPELIFHIMKFRDQTSVLLSVVSTNHKTALYFQLVC
jgi:hypothetical protein